MHVQSDILLLADVFENFRNKCNKIYELDPAHYLSARGLEWQACLKETGLKLELLTGIDMLLMGEKGIRSGICHAIHRYAKANNKYMKNIECDSTECISVESSYLMYLDANNLYELAMSQKLPVNAFKWDENIDKFHEDFMKNYDEDSNKGYILEVDVKYPKYLFNLHSDLPFLPERKKIEKYNKLVRNIHDKEHYVVHIRALKQALNHGLIF